MWGILPTLFDGRSNHAREVLADVGERYGLPVLDPPIPKTVRFAEAPAVGRSILATSRTSKGAKAYRDVAAALAAKRSDFRAGLAMGRRMQPPRPNAGVDLLMGVIALWRRPHRIRRLARTVSVYGLPPSAEPHPRPPPTAGCLSSRPRGVPSMSVAAASRAPAGRTSWLVRLGVLALTAGLLTVAPAGLLHPQTAAAQTTAAGLRHGHGPRSVTAHASSSHPFSKPIWSPLRSPGDDQLRHDQLPATRPASTTTDTGRSTSSAPAETASMPPVPGSSTSAHRRSPVGPAP